MKYVIKFGAQKHGTRTFLGSGRPVMTKKAAIRFTSIEAAQERINNFRKLNANMFDQTLLDGVEILPE